MVLLGTQGSVSGWGAVGDRRVYEALKPPGPHALHGFYRTVAPLSSPRTLFSCPRISRQSVINWRPRLSWRGILFCWWIDLGLSRALGSWIKTWTTHLLCFFSAKCTIPFFGTNAHWLNVSLTRHWTKTRERFMETYNLHVFIKISVIWKLEWSDLFVHRCDGLFLGDSRRTVRELW